MVPEITAVSNPNKSPPNAAITEMRMTYGFHGMLNIFSIIGYRVFIKVY